MKSHGDSESRAPTASRYLDRAEQLGFVDKSYGDSGDTRATYARLTERGREFRLDVERALAAMDANDPRFGAGYGRRAVYRWHGDY